jgi:hypothetical protein
MLSFAFIHVQCMQKATKCKIKANKKFLVSPIYTHCKTTLFGNIAVTFA